MCYTSKPTSSRSPGPPSNKQKYERQNPKAPLQALAARPSNALRKNQRLCGPISRHVHPTLASPTSPFVPTSPAPFSRSLLSFSDLWGAEGKSGASSMPALRTVAKFSGGKGMAWSNGIAWWDEIDGSEEWQRGIFYALCAACSLVSLLALVRRRFALLSLSISLVICVSVGGCSYLR